MTHHDMHGRHQGQDGESNRRASERVRTLKRARVILNHGYSVFDVLVRNQSAGGAMLQIADQLGVPDNFELAFGRDVHGYHCTVRWRNEKAMGVSFDEAENVDDVNEVNEVTFRAPA